MKMKNITNIIIVVLLMNLMNSRTNIIFEKHSTNIDIYTHMSTHSYEHTHKI
jgi:hypothetical protein